MDTVSSKISEYNEAFESYYGGLICYVKSIGRDHQTAEDIVHETYLKVRSVLQKTNIVNLKGFLYRVAKNQIIDDLRRSTLHSSKEQKLLLNEQINKEGKTPCQHSLHGEKKVLLKKAIADLPVRCRQVFVLHKLSGKSHKEVALQLGISVSTVEKHVMKALDHCRSHVKMY